jgi:Flp pilus assembly protein TadD
LEKIGRRSEAIKILEKVKLKFGDEVRVYNNLGIILKRNGDVKDAIASYKKAL